jgi:hypothetical protein
MDQCFKRCDPRGTFIVGIDDLPRRPARVGLRQQVVEDGHGPLAPRRAVQFLRSIKVTAPGVGSKCLEPGFVHIGGDMEEEFHD